MTVLYCAVIGQQMSDVNEMIYEMSIYNDGSPRETVTSGY